MRAVRVMGMAAVLALAGCGEDPEPPACTDAELQLASDRCLALGGRFEGEGEAEAACGAGVSGACTLEAGQCAATCEVRARRLCGVDVTDGEVSLLLSGAVVLAAEQAGAGTSVYELLADVVVQMLVHGITFSDLSEPEIDFEDGRYSFDTGRSTVGFRLTFARDWNGHAAGDPVPWNVFDPRSYVSDVSVSVGGSITNPRVDYDFEPGPLADLVDGDVDFEGRDPRSLKARVKLHADVLAIALDSHGQKRFEVPSWQLLGFVSTVFDLDVRQASTPLPVTDVVDALHEGRFVVSWAGTRVGQTWRFLGEDFFETQDVFESGDLAIGEDDEGNGWLEGEYTTVHEATFRTFAHARSGRLYTRGLLSTRSPNWTTFFCDDGRGAEWGTARHNPDLSGGVLTLADGETVVYGMAPVPAEGDGTE